MKRSINGFDIDWVDKDLIEVTRDHDPKHAYEFETSADQSRLSAHPPTRVGLRDASVRAAGELGSRCQPRAILYRVANL